MDAASRDVHRIAVGMEDLHFAAAHFITYTGGGCERLHGHNYRVAVTLEGPLNEAGYVYDYVELKRRVRAILERVDHRVLLPTRSAAVDVAADEEEVRARCGTRRYRFPREDVALLPVDNTTTERLAGWLADEVEAALRGREAFTGDGWRLTVEIEESPGQRGALTRPLEGGGAGAP